MPMSTSAERKRSGSVRPPRQAQYRPLHRKNVVCHQRLRNGIARSTGRCRAWRNRTVHAAPSTERVPGVRHEAGIDRRVALAAGAETLAEVHLRPTHRNASTSCVCQRSPRTRRHCLPGSTGAPQVRGPTPGSPGSPGPGRCRRAGRHIRRRSPAARGGDAGHVRLPASPLRAARNACASSRRSNTWGAMLRAEKASPSFARKNALVA